MTARNDREWQPPVDPCLCSHVRTVHTRGKGSCYFRSCGCGSYRPKGTNK